MDIDLILDPDPCSGPNHGDLNAVPTGYRAWRPGNALSLTQVVEHDGHIHASQNVFCSSDCMCDWHGKAAAWEQDNKDADASVPGSFFFTWITPTKTSFNRYASFVEFTAKLAEFQLAVLEYEDAKAQAPEAQDSEE